RLAQALGWLHHDALWQESDAPRTRDELSSFPARGLGLRDFGHPRLLRVGGFPHHPLAALASQQLDRIAIVDVTELSLVDAVAAQLLQSPRKCLRDVHGDAELQIFLLPHPAPAIGAGECEAPRVARVGAAAMP